MKPKTLIALLAALAACATFIVLRHSYLTLVGERGAPRAGEVSLFDPAPAGATELSIVSADGDRLAFARVNGAWRMVQPVEAKADRARVEEITDALVSPQARSITGPDAADSITGLDRPQWTVTLTDLRGRTHRLAVGRAALMSGGTRTYVRDEASKQVFVTAFDFTAALARPAGDYRDKSLWDVRQADIARVIVAGRDSYELIRRDDGWEVAARRFRAAADANRVRLLLDRLAYLTVSRFVTDSPQGLSVYGLDNPRLTVTVELTAPAATSAPTSQPATAGARRTYTLALGAPAGERVYAKLVGAATVFELPGSSLADLQPALADLRDRSVLALKASAVRGVELTGPHGRIVLSAEGDGWRMELPYPGPADRQSVGLLLERLGALAAEDFADEPGTAAAFGLQAPRGTIALHLAEGEQPVELLIGGHSPSGDMTFVKPARLSVVAIVRTADADALLEGPAAYWDRTLLKIPAAERATLLEIHRDKERTVLVTDDSGQWRMTQPISAPGDAAAVEGLLETLRDLSAQSIVSLDRTVPDTYAKADGVMTVELTTTVPPPSPDPSAPPPAATAKAQTRTYVLHAVVLEGSVYAWLDGPPPAAVGVVGSDLLEKLAAEFRLRDVGSPAAMDAERIKITLGGSECVLQRLLDQWRCQADPHLVLSAVQVGAFCQNVRLLKAQRFVSYRPGATKQKEFGLAKPHLTVEVTSAAGDVYTLTVGAVGPAGSGARYASSSAAEGVFLLSGQAILGLSKTLDDFKE